MVKKSAATEVENFDAATETLPITISEQTEAAPVSAGPEPLPVGKYPQWTADKVAAQFATVVGTLEIFRGPHWSLPADASARLGETWLSIFRDYVPYPDSEGGIGWLGELMRWGMALGVTYQVLGDAIRQEIKLLTAPPKALRPQRIAQFPAAPQPVESSPASTSTEVSEDLVSSLASEGAGNLKSSPGL